MIEYGLRNEGRVKGLRRQRILKNKKQKHYTFTECFMFGPADDIFSGQYGSDLENKLEEEVDNLLDRKERIGVAKYKWANGRLLLHHASNQLGFAVGRWMALPQVHMRYTNYHGMFGAADFPESRLD